MFKNRDVFPRGTARYVMTQRPRLLNLWIKRREDQIMVTLWKRFFG